MDRYHYHNHYPVLSCYLTPQPPTNSPPVSTVVASNNSQSVGIGVGVAVAILVVIAIVIAVVVVILVLFKISKSRKRYIVNGTLALL